MNNMDMEGAIHYDPAIDNSVDDINAYLEGTDRSLYNFRDESTDYYRVDSGLTRDIVDKISEEKHDPECAVEGETMPCKRNRISGTSGLRRRLPDCFGSAG